ncbi:MAG: hypothetical protein DRO00_07820 [Thermoproteota archaeon]|nr:MAG: hypothetical protein DRO00_07820 [Candidatus Korarchaeota archaeon]
MKKPIVFTWPPKTVAYPYVLINQKSEKEALEYLKRYKDLIRMIIIDSGVGIFKHGKYDDYPGGPELAIHKQAIMYKEAQRICPKAKILATVPDYPDDYVPQRLWKSKEVTNIERTEENILIALKKFPGIEWLIPIQGHARRPSSILRHIALLREDGILESKHFFAVAMLCIEPDAKIILETIKIARKELPDKWLHVFGPKMNSLRFIRHYIDSFDSVTWPHNLWHRTDSLKEPIRSRQWFFYWLKRVHKQLNEPKLNEEVLAE